MRLVLVGIDFNTGNRQVRDSLSFSGHSFEDCLNLLADEVFLYDMELQEAVLLETCNRIEIYLVFNNVAERELLRLFSKVLSLHHGLEEESVFACLYILTGSDVVKHLFEVSAGIKSSKAIEPNICRQVQRAYKEAETRKLTGPVLNKLFQQTTLLGRRVVNQTNIMTDLPRHGSLVIELLHTHFGSLTEMVVFVVGDSRKVDRLIEYLRKKGVREFIKVGKYGQIVEIHNQDAPAEIGGAEAPSLLRENIVVLDLIGNDEMLFKIDCRIREWSSENQRVKSLLHINLSLRSPSLNVYSPNALVYTRQDLQQMMSAHIAEVLKKELPLVEMIIDEELQKFLQWIAVKRVLPELLSFKRVIKESVNKLQGRIEKETPITQHEFAEAISEILTGVVAKRFKSISSDDKLESLVESFKFLFEL